LLRRESCKGRYISLKGEPFAKKRGVLPLAPLGKEGKVGSGDLKG